MARMADIDDLLEKVAKIQASGGSQEKRVGEIIIAITNAPTVEVAHGRWIEKQEPLPWCEDDVEVYTVCSVCESYSPGESNYCPNCGAKMDGDGNG